MSSQNWHEVISPKNRVISLNLKEIWRYRDLLMLFVKRDVLTIYKQTIFGPLWYLIQPLFTSLIYTFTFNKVAKIETGDVPAFLFNLSGLIIWNYFADCFNGTSDTFKKNEDIFGKVYFPRAVMPVSTIISNLVKLGIQMLIFIAFYIYFYVNGDVGLPSSGLIFFPIVVLMMGMMGLSLGMITSSLTTKYRDLIFLATFGIQLLMFASAVVYPVDAVVENFPQAAEFIWYNPLAILLEVTRDFYFFGGGFELGLNLVYPLIITVILFLIGLALFNKTEKSFIDTI